MNYLDLSNFYKGKRVLITGHTGFKGTWLCAVLKSVGAIVSGYALESPTSPSLFDMTKMDEGMNSYIGDIRNLESLRAVFDREQPEIVIHMAAQPLVRESYVDPVGTFEINVMGTVHILEACRKCDSVRSIVNVTTDKVYRNNEWDRGYVETDILCGYDPYSNSKSCSELVTSSYINAFLRDLNIPTSTVRAGNVIGGGDFATDRIIPDCIRAAEKGEQIIVRNPYSTRPYQHVLEPLLVYLTVAMEQYYNPQLADCYNVGPNDENCLTTGELVTLFCDTWNSVRVTDLSWINKHDGGPHEAGFLKLDSSKLKKTFAWEPKWDMPTTMKKIVEWSSCYMDGGNVSACMNNQIMEYLK